MKTKHLYFLVVIITMAISSFLVSCSSGINEQDNKFENSKMIQKLQSFNDSVKSTRIMTRGWSRKQWINVTCADFTGAYAGGKAGSWLGGKIGMVAGNPITGAVFGAAVGAIAVGCFNSWRNSPDAVRKMESFQDIAQKTDMLLKGGLAIDTTRLKIKSEKTNKKIDLNSKLLSEVNLTEKQMIIGKMHNIYFHLLMVL